MSLHPRPIPDIPEETSLIARAAFPKGNTYMRMWDELGPIFADEQFAELFSERGQPAASPAQLALVTVMQFAEAPKRGDREDSRSLLDNPSILQQSSRTRACGHARRS